MQSILRTHASAARDARVELRPLRRLTMASQRPAPAARGAAAVLRQTERLPVTAILHSCPAMQNLKVASGCRRCRGYAASLNPNLACTRRALREHEHEHEQRKEQQNSRQHSSAVYSSSDRRRCAGSQGFAAEKAWASKRWTRSRLVGRSSGVLYRARVFEVCSAALISAHLIAVS